MFIRRLLHSRRSQFALLLCLGAAIALIAGVAVSAQDKHTLKVPDGLPFAGFRGYEANDSKGWAYAAFAFEPATNTYAPNNTGTVTCGFACHTAVAKPGYIFTGYGTR
ncbi:MAG TPA: hypothetical protein VIY90_13315 [Steroidobacteraceae bacterium]